MSEDIFDCYDIESNDCDGRCQGCCDCLIVRSYRENTEYPTKDQMLEYMKTVIESKRSWDKIFDELNKDEEFGNKINSILGECKK